MGAASIAGLLAAWREAERSWEAQGTPDGIRAAARSVVEAYAAYQTAALAADSGATLRCQWPPPLGPAVDRPPDRLNVRIGAV